MQIQVNQPKKILGTAYGVGEFLPPEVVAELSTPLHRPALEAMKTAKVITVVQTDKVMSMIADLEARIADLEARLDEAEGSAEQPKARRRRGGA